MWAVRAAVVLAMMLAASGCDSQRVDPLEEFAASACAAVQTWIDAVEDDATALSRAVTPLEQPADRLAHYKVFTRSARERTDDLLRQLRRIAPANGDGRVAADRFVEAIAASLAITDELVALADEYPEEDDEPLEGRISPLLVRLEKAFTHPARARDELATRYPVFDRAPACIDYDDPVS